MPDEIEKVEFPSNARKIKSDVGSDQPHRVEKVIKGDIVKRKKNLIDRFTQTFFGDDAKSVAAYVLWDVLIPAAKDTVFDMIRTGAEMLIFGESKTRGIRRDKGKSYVSYSDYWNRDKDRRDRQDRSEYPIRTNSRHNFDDIVISSKSEAEEVLAQMVDLIETYDAVTVGDFYDMLGVTTEFTDNKYGWTNLDRAYIERVRGGYILSLPRPISLD